MKEPVYKKLNGVFIIPKAESVISQPEKRLMAMIDGDKPRDQDEAAIKKEANAIISAGDIIEIPSM